MSEKSIEQEAQELMRANCDHVCHKRGLNPWVRECPVCGCANKDFNAQAKMCVGCWAWPCECPAEVL